MKTIRLIRVFAIVMTGLVALLGLGACGGSSSSTTASNTSTSAPDTSSTSTLTGTISGSAS